MKILATSNNVQILILQNGNLHVEWIGGLVINIIFLNLVDCAIFQYAT